MSALWPPSRFRASSPARRADKPGLGRALVGGPLLAIWTLGSVVAFAAADADPYEQRLRSLGEELRCLVCQNQTLADSQSGLAEDLRREMRGMFAKGMTDRQVVDFLVQRYGDFVRYRPPVKGTTAVLWYGPGLAMLAGLVLLWRRIARRNTDAQDAAPELSVEERAQLQALIKDRTAEDSGR